MTSTNLISRGSVFGGRRVVDTLVYGVPGFMAVVIVLLLGACNKDSKPALSGEADNSATIRVISGNGRLAGGEEYEIAEWRSGALRTGGGYFADFRGQDGGPTLDLSFKGLDHTGEFSCGEAMAASLELRVDVTNAYRAAPDAPCRVEIKRLEGGVIEGYYTATLRHTGNPDDEMTVAGSFRATQPPLEKVDPEIQSAAAPKLKIR